ncbi:MAG: PIG-L family deacetylase [Gemmatimonadota bacterium]
MNLPLRHLAAAVLIAALPALPLVAQTGGAGTGGVARLAEERRLVGNWRRALMIGAHPDDENTEILTILAKGQGVETAYLSLTRGDGGQNLIGNELGVALGVLRTEELLAARRVDGGHQFFTRAFDFGFSKHAAEAFEFWPRDSVLKDAVRIIRRFRPQVIISVWSGTPADGHGHHQASGIVALDAFHAAGDSTRFPELKREEGLEPYTVAKFYRSYYGAAPPGPLITLDGGATDPVTGFSYRQLAVRSRDQHRSQNQGNLENLGPSSPRLGLIEKAPGVTGPDTAVFAGVPNEPAPVNDRHRDNVQLIESGIVLDATTDDDEVVPEQELTVTLSIWNGGKDTVNVGSRPSTGSGFAQRGDQCLGKLSPLAPGALYTCKYTATAWKPGVYTAPYFLNAPRAGAMYRWTGSRLAWGEPFEAPALQAEFIVQPRNGNEIRTRKEVQARFLDPVLGEVRRGVAVVPRVAVELSPDRLLWPRNTTKHPFRVSLENLAKDSSEVLVSLVLPPTWKAAAPQRVKFTREGERATVDFVVTGPLNQPPGEYELSALVLQGADTLNKGLYRIRYPHVGPRNILTTAKATVVVADVKFPVLAAIGYVRGGGDLVPEALLNSGLPVKLLTGEALERGSLDGFKVIVLGARAYEADESLRRAHPRLMRWLQNGGTLLIQYEQQPYMRGNFAPKPFLINNPMDRVTDEKAKVTFLAKTHPALLSPNKITDFDFDDWIQERGLDFARSWDPAWTPILETHDADDVAREGGLLVARVGKGTAIYTGLSFNRQLPAAIPGAWRLFANLLALGQPRVAH